MSTTTAELALAGRRSGRPIEDDAADHGAGDDLGQRSGEARGRAGSGSRVRPAPSASPQARPPLEVVPGGRQAATGRRLRRRSLGFACALMVLGTVFGLVGAHVRLTTNEVRLATLHARLDRAGQANVALRLRVAQLSSPRRVVASAQQLGMVPPPSVTYLTATPDGSAARDEPPASVAPGATAGRRGGGA